MRRRDAIKAVGSTVVGLGLAGCSDNSTGGQGTTRTPTPTTASSSGGQQSVTVNFASPFAADDSSYPTGVAEFAQRIEEKSDGNISVNVFPNGQQGSQLETAQKVQAGSLHLAHLSVNNWSTFVPELNVKNLPFIVKTFDQADALLESEAWNDLTTDLVRDKNFEPLVEWMFEFRHLGERPGATENGWRTPSDGEGLKVRISGSQVAKRTFEELGASPQQMPGGEMVTAMKEGVIDAIHVSRFFHCSSASQVEAYVTDPNMQGTFFTYYMNKSFFDSLDQANRDAVLEASEEQLQANKEARDSALEEANACIADNDTEVVELSDSERQQWVDQVGWENSIWDGTISEMGLTREDVENLTADL